MNRGLVMGKFLPLHIGHVGLINYAASCCDELYVLVCHSKNHVISGDIRLKWINEVFQRDQRIKPILFNVIEDAFYNGQEDLEELTTIWAKNIIAILPNINCLISGEAYCSLLAKKLGCRSIGYDIPRITSGSEIMKDPEKRIQYIVECARPFFQSFEIP